MKLIISAGLCLVLASTTLAEEKKVKREPKSENYSTIYGAVKIHMNTEGTTPIFIYGDAAEQMYNAMKSVTAVPEGNSSMIKHGSSMDCELIKKFEGGTSPGYRCTLLYSPATGGVVN